MRMRDVRFASNPDRGQVHEAGFSLVEVMVALAIGMLGIVVVMQVMQLSDAQRRTTSGSAEASTTGTLAFYDLQRQVRRSGYGLTTQGLVTCVLTLPTGANVPLVPVTINPPTALVPAGDPNTDTLLVISGNANSETEGNTIQAVDSTNYTLQMSSGFTVGDYVFPAPATCLTGTLTKVTAVPSDTKVTTLAAPVGLASLIDLGANPSVLAYRVASQQLLVCDFMQYNCAASTTAPAWTPAAGNIVSLRAQYGRDTSVPMDGFADLYDQTAPTSACTVARIVSVRTAVVTRSSQYESTVNAQGQRACNTVTTAAPIWDGSVANNPKGSAALPLDLSLSSTDWQCYRYKVLQSVIPLRNVIWMKTSGC